MQWTVSSSNPPWPGGAGGDRVRGGRHHDLPEPAGEQQEEVLLEASGRGGNSLVSKWTQDHSEVRLQAETLEGDAAAKISDYFGSDNVLTV